MSIGIFNSEDQSLIKLASNSITADETIETLNDIKVSVATDKASVAADKATVSADKADIVSMKSEIANTKTIIDETAQTVSENANSVQQEKIAIDETKTDIDKKYTEISNTASKLNTEYNNLTSNYYTKEATNSLISSTTKLKYSVVNELPTSDISTDIIYLKSTNTTSTDGIYEMYTYQDNNWVKIGTSNPDLADYYTKELADSTFATKTEINNTNTEVSELKKDLTDFEMGICYKTIGKNKFNEKTLSQGYLSNGNLVANDNWKTTDFIDVSGFNSVVFSAKNIETGNTYNASMFFFNTYDASKTLITSVNTQSAVYTVGDNVCYIRFAYEYKLYENPQLEEGSTRTSYEPYEIKYTPKDYYKNKWMGKKWVAVGDSLTAVNTRTTKHYHDYIKEYTGITVINMGESGTGYARGDSYNFYNRIEGVPTDADVVTIFGSGNDIGSGLPIGNPTDSGTDSLCGYINGTIDKLIAIIPTVSLGIVSPTPWVGYPPSTSDNTMLLYSQALKEICEIRSIPFLDLYHCSNLRPWTEEGRNACYSKDDGDGVHPDENGHKLIAPRFKAFLETLIM